MDMQSHWSQIYQSKSPSDVSWYQAKPDRSLDFIRQTGINTAAHIIDVGAGSSTLVDHLLLSGYQHITVLDISEEALQLARNRIGDAHEHMVEWIVGDITKVELPVHTYDVWHDRAAFHFLTDSLLRQRYIEQVQRAVRPGGHIIIATFATEGPEQCSGLDIIRYDPSSLHGTFGNDFELVTSTNETHVTPWGTEQKFIYCYCRLRETETMPTH